MINKTKNKELLSKVFEHFCNNEVEDARELFHKVIVEMSRDIHSELVAEEEATHDHALETDMESDLADDLDAIHGEHGSADHLDHDAEENLSDELLNDTDDLSSDGEEEHFDGSEYMGDDLESHEAHDAEEEVEVEDRLEDLEDNFEELKKMFDELSGEAGEGDVKESVELEKVTVKKSGDIGAENAAGMNSGDKAKSPFSDSKNKVEIGGEVVEIGKGPTHKGYDREEAPKGKELGKFVNRVKSSKEVLKPVGKLPAKGEVGSGKSGIPVDGNTTSLLGNKK